MGKDDPQGQSGKGKPVKPKERFTKELILAGIVRFRAPPPDRPKHFDVVSVPPGPQLTFVAISELDIVPVHFVFGRSWPHLSAECICATHPEATATRLKGYVAVYDPRDGLYKVLELSENSIQKCGELATGASILRKTLLCKRQDRRVNSRLTVKIIDSAAGWRNCAIPTIDPLDVMAEHWSAADRPNPPDNGQGGRKEAS